MTIHVHKVLSGGWDGWGNDTPKKERTLGVYDSREKAEKAKADRDAIKAAASANHTVMQHADIAFDIGASWIESSGVQ